jgi:DNA primase
VDEAVSFIDYLLIRAARFSDLQNPAGQADCVDRLLPLLRKVENQVERWNYVRRVAERLGIPINVLEQEMSPRHTPSGPAPYRPPGWPAYAHMRPSRPPRPTPTSPEYALLQLLCDDLHLLRHVQDQIASEDFQDTDLRTIYALVLRLAAQGRQTVFPHIADEVTSPRQRQLLDQMRTESPPSDPTECSTALRDYLNKIRQRRLKAQRQRIKEQLQQTGGVADAEQRLLQEFNNLSKEQPIGPS